MAYMGPGEFLSLTSLGGGGGLAADAGGAHAAAARGTLARGRGTTAALSSTFERGEELGYVLTTTEADFTITHHPVLD